MVSEIAKELREKAAALCDEATKLCDEANELRRQAEDGERMDGINREAEDVAFKWSALLMAFEEKGFTNEQAFELVKIIVTKNGGRW